jgi:serine phosphatase RsbU (regulator of sigma subunit)
MAPKGPSGHPRWRWATHPAVRLGLPLAVLVVLLLADIAAGPQIRIGGLMIAVPAIAATVLGPVAVLVVVVVTLAFVVVAAATNDTLDVENFPYAFATVVLLGAAAVFASAARQRRERQLAQVRRVAGVTQRALLPPLPDRLGSLRISSLYLASDEEATIGGDLYATAALPGLDRILIGDVQGKGLAAVETAGYLLGAFRRAARRGLDLAALPTHLDRSLREDLADPFGAESATPFRALEGFVTAVVVDFEEDTGLVRVANCGHPPPLLVHDGTVRPLGADHAALPLGLGDLQNGGPPIATFALAAGDTLLLYTDGVTEARDAAGAFYPLAERLELWTDRTPAALLETLRADLLGYAAARLTDDVALVAVHRGP